ncbi:uncharacterized protein BCR38DRAFT_452037 [Pseudomassariella vexata]|uniref:Uncharacterized protein n=1 Tax=Pseudomassariella vexata TaxID=1141098 RepID=A0A1Y2D8Q0_9PEZI|nr:uncharacterized protein BCR38DRAFT_452037 [Pseudomassariella vexata]ORY55641.1 hypothetical protein BCR38DRAFT_452037 [Pseudomassariella vexata]
MPFFGSRKEDEVVEEPIVHEEPPKRHGLFGSRRERSLSPSSTVRTSTTNHSSMTGTSYHTSPTHSHGGGGVFRRSTDASASSGRKSLLQRTFGNGNGVEMDPSIVQARERVMSAENAEQEADRALEAARIRVQEAREEVKRLELEAKEEARRAKIKQYHAREVSKRGKQLGRHDV